MAVPTPDDLLSNILLATLNEQDRKRLAPQMMVQDLKACDVLQSAGDDVVNTWFPCGSAMAAFCISTDENSKAVEQGKLDSIALRHWFSRYSDCLLAQVFQTSACNATHTITQRTAKWLLAAMNRTQANEFEMTQEQLADVLGVGRTFVTRVVRRLRDEGTIETRRGVFIVKNEQALRDVACSCTTAIEDHYDTVMRGIYPQN